MKRSSSKLPLTPLALAALALLGAPCVAQAQATKIFVASFGSDSNDGSRSSPKRNFQAAHDAVAAGGQIVALDTAGYGALTIKKSLSVTVPPGINGFITAPGEFASAVIISTTSNDIVALRGLILEGGGPTQGVGIRVVSRVGVLTVEDCTIRNFSVGVYFNTNGHLDLHGSLLRECGLGAQVRVDGGVAPAAAVVTDCCFESNGVGLSAANNPGPTDVSVEDCVFAHHTDVGITGVNGGTVWVSNSTIVGNATGVRGGVLSRGNNTVENNAAGNAIPSLYGAK